MNRFQRLFRAQKKVFIPFFTLGDPGSEASFHFIKTAIDAGADALELGLPFSDPIADGPVIQAANDRALQAGMNFEKSMQLIARIRAITDIPMGLLTYYNSLYVRGEHVYQAMKTAGLDAVLIADLSIEESSTVEKQLADVGLGSIYLVAVNTPLARAKILLQKSTAFAYIIGRRGVTGVQQAVDTQLIKRLQDLRAVSDCPLVVGFGVSEAAHVKMILQSDAQGTIVGSRLVKIIADHLNDVPRAREEVKLFIESCQKEVRLLC